MEQCDEVFDENEREIDCILKAYARETLRRRKMDNLIWYIIMIPCSALFSGIGVYAWNRKKPMSFWSGTSVSESEISDIRAYNHANGIMWGVYSLPYWAAAFAGIWSSVAALVLIAAACLIGLPMLVVTYRRIYNKYRAA